MSENKSSFSLLHPDIQRWVYREKWSELRPSQVEAIKLIRQTDNNLIISAPTASGKTEAAFLPLLSELLETKNKKSFLLYISPLKALINDQTERLKSIAEYTYIDIIPWHGDISATTKNKTFQASKCVVLITPESIEALLINNPQNMRKIFKDTNAIIIDEYHSFIGNDRGEQLFSLIYRLEKFCSKTPRKIGLSATIGDFKKVSKVLESDTSGYPKYIDSSRGSNYTIKISLKGFEYKNEKIDENIFENEESKSIIDFEKDEIPILIIKDINRFRDKTNLVFPNSRNLVEDFTYLGNSLSKYNNQKEIYYAHHGLLANDIRVDIEEKARKGNHPMTIICTSTLEMGIDIGTADNIFQIGSPFSVSTLRQRLGRSGRRGESPILRIFIAEDSNSEHDLYENTLRDKLLHTIALITLIQEDWYETPEKDGISLCTIAHQIISLISQLGGANPAQIWTYFSDKTKYDIDKEIFKELLNNLAEKELIIQTESKLLFLSDKGESLSNNYDFYSSFITEEEYRVLFSGRKLGIIPFTGMLVEEDVLALAGKNWKIIDIDEESKVISVHPTSIKGSVPTSIGNYTRHGRVLKKMKELYESKNIPPFLDEKAKHLLQQARSLYFELNLNEDQIVGDLNGKVTWFPWVGTRTINAISLLIEIASGEHPQRTNLTIKTSYSSLIQTKEFINQIDSQNYKEEIYNLIINSESKFNFPGGKWSWLLPDQLKLRDDMNRHLNIGEAISILKKFKEIKKDNS